MNIQDASISYDISCISIAFAANAGKITFPAVVAKPSTVLKRVFSEPRYGLATLFPGMRFLDRPTHQNLIASDDKEVSLPQQTMSALDYVKYLVNSMTGEKDTDTSSLTSSTRYIFRILDDIGGTYGGPVVQVRPISRNLRDLNSQEVYEVDVGMPKGNPILSFDVAEDQTYSLYYNFASQIGQPTEQYRIDDSGALTRVYSPLLSQSADSRLTHPVDKTWWT